MNDSTRTALEKRLGTVLARQRLGIEQESEPQVFGKGLNFFHPENWYSLHAMIRYVLKGTGFYWRGRSNSLKHDIVNNEIRLSQLPPAFDGFTLLHLSDLHVDINADAVGAMIDSVRGLEYDLCVLTGDYRARTNGPVDAAIDGMKYLLAHLNKPVYGVLGNHDSIRMVPELEQAGLDFLINETVEIERDGQVLMLAGIDDAHYFRVDNIEKVAQQIRSGSPSILLSHTPEVYRQASHAGFDLLLCGHTHGGQICLPGGIPLTLDANCPRYMGSGNWQHGNMVGYTSRGAGTCIVDVRLNCPPEITLHTLRRA